MCGRVQPISHHERACATLAPVLLWAREQVTRMYYDDNHLNDRGLVHLWPLLCTLFHSDERVID